jgi:hypothetical protein
MIATQSIPNFAELHAQHFRTWASGHVVPQHRVFRTFSIHLQLREFPQV